MLINVRNFDAFAGHLRSKLGGSEIQDAVPEMTLHEIDAPLVKPRRKRSKADRFFNSMEGFLEFFEIATMVFVGILALVGFVIVALTALFT